MKSNEKAGVLIKYAREHNNKISKKEAIELIGHSYYYNEAFHTGNILSRLVKSGILKRLKPGQFELQTTVPKGGSVTNDINQQSLF